MAAMTRTSTRAFDLRRADPLDFTALEEAKQQALHPRARLADFVHEHRAPVRHFQHADAIAIGTREGAALVPEQLALEQRLGDGGAVDGDRG